MYCFLEFALAGLFVGSTLASPVEPRTLQQPKTPVDAAVYEKLVYYTPFAPAAGDLEHTNCSNPPHGSVLEKYFNNTQSDTQAAIFRTDSVKEIVLGIPGTASDQDYVTDFTFIPVPYLSPNTSCPLCLVHVGFLGAWNSIADDVLASLKDLSQKYSDYKVVVAGHSLGGALAQLAYASVAGSGLPVKYVFTYGQPRVGNLLFANYIDQLAGANETEAGIFHRVTHSDDGVPQLPPIILGGFVHSRTEYWESANPPSLETTYRCYGQEPADCNDQAGGVGINAAHGGYAGLNYTCTP